MGALQKKGPGRHPCSLFRLPDIPFLGVVFGSIRTRRASHRYECQPEERRKECEIRLVTPLCLEHFAGCEAKKKATLHTREGLPTYVPFKDRNTLFDTSRPLRLDQSVRGEGNDRLPFLPSSGSDCKSYLTSCQLQNTALLAVSAAFWPLCVALHPPPPCPPAANETMITLWHHFVKTYTNLWLTFTLRV
jgi:hypothetical protein